MQRFLLPFLFIGVITSAKAQLYYKGSNIGNIETDGDVYVGGSRVGKIEDDGDIYIKTAAAKASMKMMEMFTPEVQELDKLNRMATSISMAHKLERLKMMVMYTIMARE